MNENSGTFELMEPTSPEALVPDSWLEPWMLVTLIVVALAVVALVVFMKKKAAPVDPLAIRRAAHMEAAAALEKIGPVAAREAAVQSSLILRRYLSVVAGDPALFETHEEYLSRHEALKDFSDEARGSAGLGFTRLAKIKYSATDPDMDTPQVIAGSRTLLEILNTGLRA